MDGKEVSTIGRERRFNQALELAEDDFVTFRMDNVPPLPKDFDAIKRENLALELAPRPS